MSRLFFGLLLTGFFALFILGYVLDQLAGSTDYELHPLDPLSKQLLEMLLNQATQLPPQQLADQLMLQGKQAGLTLEIMELQSVALPAETITQLTAGEMVILANAEQHLGLVLLPAYPELLVKLVLPEQQELHPLSLWLTLGLYLGLACCLLLWQWPLLQRLRLLNQHARRFGAGDYNCRIAASRFSYIPELEHSFNTMAEQISQLLAENKLLANSLSHDLRTPIACLRFGLEALAETTQPDKVPQLVVRMERELDRMERMVNAFLDFATLSRREQHVKMQVVDLANWLKLYAENIHPLVTHKGLTLELQIAPVPARVQIDSHWLERALDNIINNGCRYAKSRLRLSLLCSGKQHQIWICDDGDGIASSDFQRVLQPFFRIAQANESEGHFGLGLAISQQILSWHQGRLAVNRDPELGGAALILSIPAAEQPGSPLSTDTN